jgi:ABC-type multidrug transport system fused ATPase/permease subunit
MNITNTKLRYTWVSAGDRVFYLLDREPSEPATGNKEVQLVGKMEVSATDHTTHDDITLSNVSFSYPTRPESLALNSCSIQIQSGSLVALVGHSGCGSE